MKVRKEKNEGKEWGWVESIEIGEYNSCCDDCVYWYGNLKEDVVRRKGEKDEGFCCLVVGEVKDEDMV